MPLAEAVTIGVQWASISPNPISNSAVAGLVVQPLVDYINGIYTGDPINLIVLEGVFKDAVSPILPAGQISKLNFAVTIAGVSVALISGEKIYPADAFSYLTTTSASITCNMSIGARSIVLRNLSLPERLLEPELPAGSVGPQ